MIEESVPPASPLAQTRLLRGVPPAQVAELIGRFKTERYAPRDFIVREAERGDSLFIVESGMVEVVVRSNDGSDSVLSRLGPGETFGEMALLTGEPRSAAVRAMAPTVVRVVPRDEFLDIAVRYPVLLFNLSRVLVGRLSQASRVAAHARQPEVVAIVGDVPPVLGSLIATNLAAALSTTTHRRVLLVDVATQHASRLPGREQCPALAGLWSKSEGELSVPPLRFGASRFKAVSLPEDGGLLRAIRPLSLIEAGAWMRSVADFVVVNLVPESVSDLQLILSQADQVYVLVTANQLAAQRGRERLAAALSACPVADRVYPVVLSDDGASLVDARERTRMALGRPARVVLPGQVQLLRDASREPAPMVIQASHLAFSRTMRWLARDTAHLKVGLALGAGGARGFAHVGVFRFLEQFGIPNDYIAGTSMGSVIGAPRALGMDIQQGEEVMRRLHEKFTNLLRPTMSLMTSLLSPKGTEETFRELVGDATFEELPVPFAAVAADLETAKPIVLRRGSVAQAIRASSAIPMVWPPVEIGPYRLVDGGVLNPVPTQPVRDLGADIVIAVDLSGRAAHDETPTGPQLKRQPNIFQNLLRCHDIMMADRAVRDCLLADVVIRPRFATVGWKHFDKADDYAAAGYAAASEAAPALRKLLPWLDPEHS
jgi:NTE family protein